MNDDFIEFYVNKFCYVSSVDKADVSFITPIMRRRLSAIDKCSLFVLNNIYSEYAQNLVFSSQKGEEERLIKIINQYTEEGGVSPNTFAGSVHNYAAGFFLLNKQKSIPYNAISASTNSAAAGLLAAVASNYDNILYCYAYKNADDYCAFGINISKKSGGEAYVLKLKNSDKTDSFTDYIDIFSGKKDSLETKLFNVKRVK